LIIKKNNELKNHKWFNGFDWKNFEKKKNKSPLKFKEKRYNKKYCKFFVISKKDKNKHLKYEKNKIYKKSIKKYEYVNEKIIKAILKSYIKK
jgi:spermidine synthase